MSRIFSTPRFLHPACLVSASIATPSEPASPLETAPLQKDRYRFTLQSQDFGRLKVLSVMNMAEEDLARKRRKRRRGCFRKTLLLQRPRGKDHLAAQDERYRRLFPWRDQGNQLFVHPELADPADRTKVDPGLRLLTVSISLEDTSQIFHDIGKGLFPEKMRHASKLDEQERDIVRERYRKLLANLHASLEKSMRGEEPVPPEEVYVRALEEADLAPGESSLKGQYGLFNRKGANGKWRSVTEGMHLCFFGGFFCRSAAEYDAECIRYSPEEVTAYALTIGETTEYPCISPYGGGDLGQFANSALTRDARGRFIEDKMRTNTRFARAEMTFEDNRPGGNQQHLVYPLVFLYMLAGPQTEGADEREARVWYGKPYWDNVQFP